MVLPGHGAMWVYTGAVAFVLPPGRRASLGYMQTNLVLRTVMVLPDPGAAAHAVMGELTQATKRVWLRQWWICVYTGGFEGTFDEIRLVCLTLMLIACKVWYWPLTELKPGCFIPGEEKTQKNRMKKMDGTC